jgi:hypothetical protein
VSPQVPQLFGSELRETQAPEHWVCPGLQAEAQAPLLQTSPAEQTLPQDPQLAGVLLGTQAPLHWSVPEPQGLDGVGMHRWSMQESPAPQSESVVQK